MSASNNPDYQTEYGVRIDGDVVTFSRHTLADYQRTADVNGGQVVVRQVGPWLDYVSANDGLRADK